MQLDSNSENSASSVISDLSIQNRLLTQAHFLYEAACRSTSTQLKSFIANRSPTKQDFLSSSSDNETATPMASRLTQMASRLTNAEALIQDVMKTLQDVVETQRSVPLALGKLEGVSISLPNFSCDETVEPTKMPLTSIPHRKGSSHRSPSPSPGPRIHHESINGETHVPSESNGRENVKGGEKNGTIETDQRSGMSREDLDDDYYDGSFFKLQLSDEMKTMIQEAKEERDSFWRDRIKDEKNMQLKLLEVQIKESMTKRFTQLIDAETKKLEKIRDERDSFKLTSEEQMKEIVGLKKKIMELQTEVDAGMKIIYQFSQLMKDKASSLCQYCRRSGTLPPIPSR